MRFATTARIYSVVLIIATLAAIGCESGTAPNSAPPVKNDRTDVKVDVGGGRGINVDVDAPDRPLRRDGKGADLDVNVGGGEGIRVDVDDKP